MENPDILYRKLQQHLDKQAVGFPATESGVEIRILKHLFTPDQARVVLHVDVVPRPTAEISARAKDTGFPPEKVAGLLHDMLVNGAITSTEKNGEEYYFTLPLLVGIVELHAYNATPDFWADFNEYMAGGFGRAFTTSKTSQMRTIPVRKSITAEHHVTTYDHVKDVINNTEGPIVISPCMCREGFKARGVPCKKTSRIETCMSFGDWARRSVQGGNAKVISKEEALEIMRQNEEDGLVLQPNNYEKIDFICACCGCCCGILRIHQRLPNPAVNWAHNFYAAVSTEDCTGCGLCVERCQVNAVTLDETTGHAVINFNRCIGCGNCVTTCPSEALKLVKKKEVIAPPEDAPALYKILSKQ